jgi:Vault protein inter-alpha-trypsin domain
MSTAAMLERLVVVVVVAGCSSGAAQPPARADVRPLPVQSIAAARAVAPVRAPVAAFTLTASDGTGLALSKVDARAVIEGPLAFTELHLYFRNTEARVREGTFAITLPTRAAISRFGMYEGTQVKEAEVVPKALARRAYDDFLQRRVDPALLEKAPGNQFTARVFPIPANSEKHIVLSYSQELAGEGYTLPLNGLPKIDRVDVTLTAIGADGQPHVQTLAERAWQPDRDFVAEVASTAAVADGALVAGVFDVAPTFTEAAMRSTAPDRPTALTVLVDTSASRALGYARYLEEVRALIGALARGGELHVDVIAFDQTTQPIYSGAAKELGDAQIALLAAPL